MRMKPECYVCALRQALSASRLVSDDESFQVELLVRTSRIISEIDPTYTPPEAGELVYRAIREISGKDDPFEEQKRIQNENALRLLPWLESMVSKAEDPLLMSARLSIAGNAIDTGAQESFDLEGAIRRAVEGERELRDYKSFKHVLEKAKKIVLVADNSGEIVFDRVLLETIKDSRDGEIEITVAVRGGPIINDVTEKEARFCGMDEISEIISTDMEMPGTLLSHSNPDFLKLFRNADVVLSKGQGNWETLEGCNRGIFFLLQAKCPVVARANQCEFGELLLLEGNHK
ncbi:MAG: ARMT1-like domain-containing protein [Actinomycetota bacterium]|nr:ARMT1-like domain-containing protein [Actinomycetota bacterium]